MALRHEKRLLQKSEINLGREGTAQAASFPELRNEIGEEGHVAVRHLVNDLERYMELGREMPTGELLYLFQAGSTEEAASSPAQRSEE